MDNNIDDAIIDAIADESVYRQQGKSESVVTALKHGRAMQQSNEAQIVESVHEAQVILSRHEQKQKLKEDAYKALEMRLQTHKAVCKKCKGRGEVGHGEIMEECPLCEGTGLIEEAPDMRAVELVLKPEFPTTNVNISANLDKMDKEALIEMLNRMASK